MHVDAKERQKRATDIALDPDEYYKIKLKTFSISKTLLNKQNLRPFAFIQRNPEYLPFIIYLARGKSCKLTGGRPFSRNMLAHMLGKHPNRVRLREFLEKCKREFLPELEWTEYEYVEGWCTVITCTGLQHLLDQISCDIDDDRVFALSMRKVTERSKHQLEKELRALVSQRVWQFKDQAIIAMYLHNLPYNLFAEGERHFHEAYKMAYKLDEEIKERNPDSPQKNHHKNVLLAVRDMWKVFYSPTGKTPRMFGTDLTFLKSTIRHVLFPHWIDFDLKNCQLSIVAGLYHVPKTQEFLKTGASIWKELTVYMGIAEDRRATAKEFLKQALYSIVYGMTMTEAERSLQDDLGCRGIWWNNDFTSHPIIREVARAIRRAIKDIREQGGMKSAYGWMALEEGEKEETVLANAIQSYELSIVAACYKLAIREAQGRNGTWKICLHQHDGISVVVKEGVDLGALERRINKVVKKQAATHNMEIEMEMKGEGRKRGRSF